MRQFYFLLPLKKYKYQAVSHNFLCNKLLIIQVQIHKVMQFNPGSFLRTAELSSLTKYKKPQIAVPTNNPALLDAFCSVELAFA